MNIELRRPMFVEKAENAVNKEKKYSHPFSLILLILTAAVLAFSVVALNIKTDEANARLDEVSAGLQSLVSEQKALEKQIDEKISTDEAIKIAVDEYGMVKAESLPQMYVSVSDGDRGMVMEKPEEKKTVGTIFSAIGESLSAILEYMRG